MRNYFAESEFRGQYHLMHPKQIKLLNLFRHEWGKPVIISGHPDALGRHLGSSKSFHNLDRYGKVMATDILPRGFETKADFKRGFEIAKAVGFTGIGIYPDWQPQAGMHVDIGKRAGRGPGNPAKWSAFRINDKQQYFGIDRAFI